MIKIFFFFFIIFIFTKFYFRSSQNSSSSEESNQINSATEQVNCQLQDLRLNPNFDETPKSCQNDAGSEKTQQNSMTVDSVGNRTQDLLIDSVSYAVYENELQMPDIMKLIQKDLSEPYSIYTYRYFIHNWPHLCYMVRKFCGKLIKPNYFKKQSSLSSFLLT